MGRTNHATWFAAAALLAGCAHHPAAGPAAVPARSLQVNSEATARLTANDPHLADNTVYQVWSFYGGAGDMIQVDVMSARFDAWAALEDPDGKELAHDDDSGGGTNARIRYALPATGTYRIVARAYRPGELGAYRIRVTRLGLMIPGGNGATIQRGQLMSGRLSQSDARMSDNSVYHVYNYMAQAGEAVTIDVMSDDFDAFAILQDPQGNEVARDDDSGDERNARIQTVLRQTGMYRIIVNTYAPNATGQYTIWVH